MCNGQVRVKRFFWETYFSKIFVKFEPSIIGCLAGKDRAGLLKLDSTRPVKLLLGIFFWQTFSFENLCALRDKYLRSFSIFFLFERVVKAAFYLSKRIFRGKTYILEEKLHVRMFRDAERKNEVLKSFFSTAVKIETYMSGGSSWAKIVVCEEKNSFHDDLRVLARKIWSSSLAFLQGCQIRNLPVDIWNV